MNLDAKVPRKNSKVKVRKEKFGKLLLFSGLPLLCINEDAEKIWDLCDGENSISNMIDICHRDVGSIEQARDGVINFIDEACRLNLLTIED